MAIADRTATAVWKGGLKSGGGVITTQSGVLKEQEYSFVTRFENKVGTNPEELIAAAHAGCYSMALSAELDKAGHPPASIDTTAKVTLDMVNGAPTVNKILLTVKGSVPGIDAAKFQEFAEGAKKNCPISRLLAAAEITLDAQFVG
ncbi:OsmC family protein [Terriglobus tenax]|uniref:OsmC family protein n=1 Tax=Terriglobus tenax TaxID=1111115 RepID=UPI0021E08AB9|nr:OsmC family protein [Terriglobus tenax]